MKLNTIYLLLSVIVLGGIAACNKNASDAAPKTVDSYLDVVNATDNTFNVYVNGTRQNSTASIYAPGSSGYLTVLGGKQTYSFKPPVDVNTLPIRPNDTTFSKSLTLDSAKQYSLFVCGTTANSAFLVKDSLSQVTAGTDTAVIRFAHAAPSFAAVKVTINDTLRFSGQSYQSVSSFIAVPAGTSKVINIYLSNGTTPIATTTATLTSGYIYTLFVKDIHSGTATAAGAGLVVNND